MEMLNNKCSNMGKDINRSFYMLHADNYKTIKEMAKKYTPLFTEASLRQMIHKDTNGINECVFRIGGKVLFNIEKFEKWFKGIETNKE